MKFLNDLNKIFWGYSKRLTGQSQQNTGKICKICSKLTRKTPEHDVVLVCSDVSLKIWRIFVLFLFFYSIYFEQVNVCWSTAEKFKILHLPQQNSWSVFLYKLLKTESLVLKLNLFVIFYARIIIIPKDNPKFFSLDQNQLSL